MISTAGLGFKLEHLDEVLKCDLPALWFEVHAENYMVDGGPRLWALDAVRERFPISLHSVGLSLLSEQAPATAHLQLFRRLIDRIQPVFVSDHLAWQRWGNVHHSDFLPFPRTTEALDRAVANVGRVQEALGRQILVENPSLYVGVEGHEMDETAFLSELAKRSGCGLLVDVNNIYVSAHNLNFSAERYVDALPPDKIEEIHLAGHSIDADGDLLIDSHDTPVADAVWRLYNRLITRAGPRPTLIERDDHLPPFPDLLSERLRAQKYLGHVLPKAPAHA